MCGGLGMIGLADLLANDVFAASVHTAGPHFPPTAKHVILLFMTGGPSQVDLWDPKPALLQYAGQRPATANLRTERTTAGLLPSKFTFARQGKSGIEMSELMPNLATVADELCVELKSLKYYMIEFRNRGIYYEHVTNQILDDLVAALQPRRMTVVGDFSVRGGIKTVVTAEYTAEKSRV